MIAAVSTSPVQTPASAGTSRADKPRPSADEVFKKLDSDSKGYLTESDLVKISPAGTQAADADAKAQAAFKRMDTDGDGKVSESEFKAAAPPAGARQADGDIRSGLASAGGKHHAGGGKGGGGAGGAGASASSTTQQYDPADTNKDGKVSQQEQVAYDAKIQATREQAAGADAPSVKLNAQANEAVNAYESVAQTAD